MAPGVHVSRTLVPPDRLVDVTVRVVNVLSEPQVFVAGTIVADLHPVEVIGEFAAELAESSINQTINK